MRQVKSASHYHSTTSNSRLWSGLSARLCTSPLFRSWWVLLFLILSFSFYTHAMQKKEDECILLKKRLSNLHTEKSIALEEKEDLLLQIGSQSDPAWIQMTLMKGLGLVPEGQQKVYFKED